MGFRVQGLGFFFRALFRLPVRKPHSRRALLRLTASQTTPSTIPVVCAPSPTLRFRDSGSRVQGLGFWVQGLG